MYKPDTAPTEHLPSCQTKNSKNVGKEEDRQRGREKNKKNVNEDRSQEERIKSNYFYFWPSGQVTC